jgi:PAS domain S-box-containing protein
MNAGASSSEQERIAALLDALRASEEFKTRLIESSRDCIKVLDLDGNLLSMNAGGMEVLEICDLGPFLHTSWIDFWQGDDRARARAAVQAARTGGVGRFVGFFPTTQTRKPMWFDVVVNAICDAHGRPERLLALSRDITELKLAEDVLRRSHEDLERLVQARTAELTQAKAALERDVIERKQAEATRHAIVQGVEAQTGDRFFPSLVQHLAAALGVQYAFVSEISADRTRFRTLAVWGRGEFLSNFEVPLAGTPCEAVLNGQMSHYPDCLQARFPTDTGLAGWRAESYGGVPLIDSSATVVGHLAIIDDKPMREGGRALAILRIFATRAGAELERLRVDAALRESEERLSRIIESAMDAIVTLDDTHRVVLFNAAAEKIFHCAAAATIGQPFDRFLTDGFRRTLDHSLQALRSGDGSQPYVWAPEGLMARSAAGREFPIEATISHVRVGGRTLSTIILRDVDERRRAEEQLRQLHLQNEYLQEEIRAVHNVDEIVGQSAALRDALEKVRLVSGADSSVLILGETGTGKELIARAVHSSSPRKERPLIKVNCAALPTGLIESELFGHEKGAFTGATERRIGRFELAHGGTIFLDEIGEVPAEVQVKLLRVLQEHEFERIGGSQTIAADVRVIAATNRDLSAAVAAGTFRPDLYYRLAVFPITLPPLRSRREDIALLVHYFVNRFAAKIGRKITRVSRDTMQRLAAYAWPGNVRELENVIERAVILSPGPNLHVAPEMLLDAGSAPIAPAPVAHSPAPSVADRAPDTPAALQDVERSHILAVLKQTRWRIDGPQGAARVLNMNPSTLRSRLKKLGIRRSAEQVSP